MAITFSKEKKRINYLILTVGVILLLAVIFAWRGFLIKPKFISPTTPKPPEEIKINFEILKSSILKDLQPFEEIAPFKEEIGGEKLGRENPFLPY